MKQLIKQQYPDGKIKVLATGLQCIGFNTQLYDALRRRFANDPVNGAKRKAEDEGKVEGSKRRKADV
jgi:hypothetical protein